jgi:hypothetical protein
MSFAAPYKLTEIQELVASGIDRSRKMEIGGVAASRIGPPCGVPSGASLTGWRPHHLRCEHQIGSDARDDLRRYRFANADLLATTTLIQPWTVGP